MRKSLVIFLILVFVLSFSSVVSAFDGQRKGFILGFGIGPGYTSFTQEVGSISSDRENSFAIQTDFKIGLGTTEQFQIYWQSKVSWFSMTNALNNDVTVAHGFGGIGFSYYLKPETKTLYLTGGLGYSSWGLPFESNAETWMGLGITLGAGYEFSPHWNLEGNLMFGKPSDDSMGIDISTNGTTIRAVISYLAY